MGKQNITVWPFKILFPLLELQNSTVAIFLKALAPTWL